VNTPSKLPEIGSCWRKFDEPGLAEVREVSNSRFGWRVSCVHRHDEKVRVLQYSLKEWPMKFSCLDDE
jgi:hypothetical protein